MQITIIAPGSRGDVQPYVALGQGLRRAGHHIRFVTHQNFEPLVTSHGIEFWSVDSNVQAIVESQAMRDGIEQGNSIALMKQMAQEARRQAEIFARAGLAAARDMDLIIAGIGGVFIGLAIAEKTGLPLLQAYVVPLTPTRVFPSVLTPTIPSPLNRISHHLAKQLMWQGFRPADSLARREVLDLPPAPFSGPYQSERTRGLPILYGFSPSVIPPPRDWDEDQRVTGFWFLEEEDSWTPPPALLDFLKAGPPPVYIGFGSMSNRRPEETANLVVEALKRTSQRAILLSGWSGLHKNELPDTIFMVDSIPHSWLFKHVTAVVHHGGASTTAAGLRAGIPSIIIPFFGDQPFWGRRVAELGVGPQPIPRAKLTVDRLAIAIRQAVMDESMRERARQLGGKIQEEDGLARAVDVIQKIR